MNAVSPREQNMLMVTVVIVLYAGRTMLAGRFQGSPILISKVNTAVQIALAAFVLANLAFGWENGRGVEALIYAAAATTAASAAGYLFRAGDLS